MEIFITGNDIKLTPIGKGNLSLINLWYRQVDAFGYATGGKNPEEIMLEESHSLDSPCFVVGIYPANQDNCIGLIAGELKNVREPVLWVRTFLVDTVWQRKHFGTQAFKLLCDYVSRNYRIKRVFVSVSEENYAGTSFWESLGFLCVKVLKNTEDKSNHNVLIFEKVIKP